jgi:hypothetical protein
LYALKPEGCPSKVVKVNAGAGPEESPAAAKAVEAMTTAAMAQRFKRVTVETRIDLSS